MMTRAPTCASWIAVAALVGACDSEKQKQQYEPMPPPYAAPAERKPDYDWGPFKAQRDGQAPEQVDAQAPEQGSKSGRSGGVCKQTEPPTFMLSSVAGDQVGVNGSYCGGPADPSCGLGCADRGVAPAQYTVVHQGDELTISMPAGKLVPGPNCNPACPPRYRLFATCPRRAEVDAVFVEDVPIRIEVPAGIYAMLVESNLEGDEGWVGGSSGAFGLIIDAKRARAIVAADSVSTACGAASDAGPDAAIDAAAP
jgi:hypothetical protein